MIIPSKLKIIDPVRGFTEREAGSKAILNTDVDSLLKYKIQKRQMSDINRHKQELSSVRTEIDQIKSDLGEIKQLLLQINKN
jgi:hypothetical protein